MLRHLAIDAGCRIIARTLWARPQPDRIIGGAERPYMRRWYLIPRNPVLNVYLHEFLRSDDDRALHDHPWWNISFLVIGEYNEHTISAGGINVRTHRKKGDLKFRLARNAHRIELIDGASCWTIFITGPLIRQWGFHCAKAGWIPAFQFTKELPGGVSEVGAGCGE